MTDITLLRLLDTFSAALALPSTREIIVNTPGRFAVEGDDGWSWHDAADLTFKRLDAIATLAASRTSKRFGIDRPTCSAVLPNGERIAIARPPATAPGTIKLNIRKRAKSFTPTVQWLEQGGYFKHVPGYDAAFWQDAINQGKTVVVCGSIGSGKTTMTEALLRAIPDHLRLVTIEDTPEWLDLPHENWAPLYFDGERRTAIDCLREARRMRPDWLPMQELLGDEAWAFLGALIVGHPGITTVHSNDCASAFDAIAVMIRQSQEGRGMEEATVNKLLRQHIDIVAHCAREPFRITEVMEVGK